MSFLLAALTAATATISVAVSPAHTEGEGIFEFAFDPEIVSTDRGLNETMRNASLRAKRYCRDVGYRDLMSRRLEAACEDQIMTTVSAELDAYHTGSFRSAQY